MIISLLALAAAQGAVPPVAPAHPAKEQVVREIIILEHKDGTKATADAKASRRDVEIIREVREETAGRENVRIIRTPGTPRTRMAVGSQCEGGRRFETEADGGQPGEKVKTRVLLCTTGGQDSASHAQGLERAAKRVAENKDIPADVRDRVLASLNAEIARVKASK